MNTTESHVRVVENQMGIYSLQDDQNETVAVFSYGGCTPLLNAKANAEHMARLWNEEADRRMADMVDRIMAEHQFNVTDKVWDAMGY